MMKIIGAVFIIGATSWIGFEAARQLSERAKQLRLLKSALQSLEAEIMFGHAPLHEASRRIAKQLKEPLSQIFGKFSTYLLEQELTAKEAWDLSLINTWNETAMKQEELEILHQFGETLGKHDLIQQQKQIRLALTHLERQETEAREKQLIYGKMMKSLGFLSGLLLVLLLV
ncbi:stage III sporulation protein SpoIIIAB [Bacillus kwashiorkori]|uniref:stage III sporulation protein SpoIIIAB n=1 Tax=Bacillus kwashiorkori TaxID=1522318 RepID=UPI00078500A4|nr:stage III sporulation protein SpoIIIAB [Bacillus kwashiorkori]